MCTTVGVWTLIHLSLPSFLSIISQCNSVNFIYVKQV